MIDRKFAPSRGAIHLLVRRRLCHAPLIVFLWVFIAPAWAQDGLTLAEALERTQVRSPELRVFEWRGAILAGRRQQADQAPGFELGLQTESLIGTGDLAGFDGAEVAVSLSSVFELGDKRRKRTRVVDSRLDQLDADAEARAMDVFGEVTQRFIAALALQEKLAIARDAVALAETNRTLVSERVERGAAPAAERLRAKAALALARLEVAAIEAEHTGRLAELASYWGEVQADFNRLAGNLFRSAPVADFQQLDRRVAATPAIERFASTARLRDAELALARSRSSADIRWNVGTRYNRSLDDTAVEFGLSLPLFTGSRNRGNVQSARAAREVVETEAQSALAALRARVFGAWQAHKQASGAVETLQTDVIPTLTEALSQTRAAWEQGRYTYLEWIAAQRELLQARRALVDAAGEALLNQALIEQLTARSLAESLDSARP